MANKGIEKIGRGVFPEEESTSRGQTSKERDNSNGRTTLSINSKEDIAELAQIYRNP
ncbi:MAG: hypothetical protein RSC31_06630 [Anaerovoracaceae bacterium]